MNSLSLKSCSISGFYSPYPNPWPIPTGLAGGGDPATTRLHHYSLNRRRRLWGRITKSKKEDRASKRMRLRRRRESAAPPPGPRPAPTRRSLSPPVRLMKSPSTCQGRILGKGYYCILIFFFALPSCSVLLCFYSNPCDAETLFTFYSTKKKNFSLDRNLFLHPWFEPFSRSCCKFFSIYDCKDFLQFDHWFVAVKGRLYCYDWWIESPQKYPFRGEFVKSCLLTELSFLDFLPHYLILFIFIFIISF